MPFSRLQIATTLFVAWTNTALRLLAQATQTDISLLIEIKTKKRLIALLLSQDPS